MIKFYLQGVLIFMIIIYSSIYIMQDKIKDNGWVDVEKKSDNKWFGLFVVSAIPVVRVLIIVCIFMMAAKTKEEFDKFVEDNKHE